MNTQNISKLNSVDFFNKKELSQYQIDNSKSNNTNQVDNSDRFKLFHGIYWDIFKNFNESLKNSKEFALNEGNKLITTVFEEYIGGRKDGKLSIVTRLLDAIKNIKTKVNCKNFQQYSTKYNFTFESGNDNFNLMYLDSSLDIKTLNSK